MSHSRWDARCRNALELAQERGQKRNEREAVLINEQRVETNRHTRRTRVERSELLRAFDRGDLLEAGRLLDRTDI